MIFDNFEPETYNQSFGFADVAELVDARVSEARDGDIVEVRFFSSAFKNNQTKR